MNRDRSKILIVDDSLANIQVLNVILQCDYDVFFAQSGCRALEMAKVQSPDLILLDVMMPGMDGYETCRRLKADAATRSIPVIFVSALSEDEDESRGFEAGGVDYIPKPFRMHTIKARILTHLELRNHQIALERLVKDRTQELYQAYERLKFMEKTKSDLLSSVSHELRTPLTSLIGFAQMSGKKLQTAIAPIIREQGDPARLQALGQIEDNLKVILEEGGRLTRLVDNVMDLMLLISRTMDIAPEPVDVSQALVQAVALVEREYLRKKIFLDIALPSGLARVQADPERLVQILANLLSNAVKFTDKGNVNVQAREEGDMVAITVKDEGIGIAAHYHRMIFETFYQIGEMLTNKPKGLGLGLAICKKLAELHGGSIRLESEPDQGAAFTLTLPKAF